MRRIILASASPSITSGATPIHSRTAAVKSGSPIKIQVIRWSTDEGDSRLLMVLIATLPGLRFFHQGQLEGRRMP